MKDKTKNNDSNDVDSFENYFQNAIASMGVMGALGSAPTSEIELIQINPNGIETNNNFVEKKEKAENVNKEDKKV